MFPFNAPGNYQRTFRFKACKVIKIIKSFKGIFQEFFLGFKITLFWTAVNDSFNMILIVRLFSVWVEKKYKRIL